MGLTCISIKTKKKLFYHFFGVSDEGRFIPATIPIQKIEISLIASPEILFSPADITLYIRGVFNKYADRCCHSLSFLLKGVKLAHNHTQRIMYAQ